MSKTFVVVDDGCGNSACCVETHGVFSSLDKVKAAFPDHSYVPTTCGYGELVREVDGYFVDYYVYSYELDVRKDG
jgi:hypothetical protein